MLLGEPPRTPVDINFELFGFPVRVHPFFWIVALILGARGDGDPVKVFLWVVAVFVSVVVHELGHAFTQRYYGGRPWITLTALGGLASCDDCDRSPRAQIIISAAGPIAGFLLATLVLLGIVVAGHQIISELSREVVSAWAQKYSEPPVPVPLLIHTWYVEPFHSMPLNEMIFDLLFINIWWGLLNLLPIYPLDGGRIARELFTLGGNPREAIVRSLWLSAGTAAAVAVYGLTLRLLFMPLMFGYLAYLNYQAIQSYQGYSTGNRW